MNENHVTEILVPVFNEEKNIEIICDEILKFQSSHSLLVHFVDDGSTDNTWREILNCSKKSKFIKGNDN
jgi:glycosyltransferase involved in cell wall biosynthesis